MGLKEFEVDVKYEANAIFSKTFKVKAENKQEAKKQIDDNMFEGKDLINSKGWEQEYDNFEDVLIEVREENE